MPATGVFVTALEKYDFFLSPMKIKKMCFFVIEDELLLSFVLWSHSVVNDFVNTFNDIFITPRKDYN